MSGVNHPRLAVLALLSVAAAWGSTFFLTKDLLTRMAAIHHPRVTYLGYDELLADPQVQAVLVATADQFHADIYNPHLNIQVIIGAGWGADFPAPSTFFCSSASARWP